jgi:hypothetical protein
MVAEFIATETGTEDDVHFITTGVARSDPPHYLMFSRSLPFGSDEDWGVEIEFDDQINSGYRKIRTCSLSPDRLLVELKEPIGRAAIHRLRREVAVEQIQFELVGDWPATSVFRPRGSAFNR